jgi:hypothetical protein
MVVRLHLISSVSPDSCVSSPLAASSAEPFIADILVGRMDVRIGPCHIRRDCLKLGLEHRIGCSGVVGVGSNFDEALQGTSHTSFPVPTA